MEKDLTKNNVRFWSVYIAVWAVSVIAAAYLGRNASIEESIFTDTMLQEFYECTLQDTSKESFLACFEGVRNNE